MICTDSQLSVLPGPGHWGVSVGGPWFVIPSLSWTEKECVAFNLRYSLISVMYVQKVIYNNPCANSMSQNTLFSDKKPFCFHLFLMLIFVLLHCPDVSSWTVLFDFRERQFQYFLRPEFKYGSDIDQSSEECSYQ